MNRHVLDVVCGMVIDPVRAAARTTYRGAGYHFCSEPCKAHFIREPELFVNGGAPERAGVSTGDSEGTQLDVRPCPQCGSPVEVEAASAVVGELTVDEYVTIVRHRWRARLGRRAFAREHRRSLIRALVVHALKPESPVVATCLEHELTLEVARLRAEGLNRAHVQRELYHLSRAASEVLLEAGLPATRAAEMIGTIDHRLLALIEWRRSPSPRDKTTGRRPEQVA